jgi:hypothetical protein
MGHPGAPNHDHHRSVWFAHHKVLGMDFWSDDAGTQIRQTEWLAYEDGDSQAVMAVRLRWLDGHDPTPLVHQELIVAVSPTEEDGLLIELQSSLTSEAESLELGQTNFGLLAVRVAKAISGHFGDGVISGPDGVTGEQNLFGLPASWIDYSGSIREGVVEGITYFDHVTNATFPSKWHVREDGWMGASICRDRAVMLNRQDPNVWRYLLHVHAGPIDQDRAAQVEQEFHQLGPLRVARGGQHVEHRIERDPR